MQLLEVSGAVWPIYGSLGIKRLRKTVDRTWLYRTQRCINDPFYQYRSWIIWKHKHNDISRTYVYFRSDHYAAATVQTSACFVHVTVTVVTCHEPAGDIQYKPTPTLHCVLWSAHPDQDSRCIQVRHSSDSVHACSKTNVIARNAFQKFSRHICYV